MNQPWVPPMLYTDRAYHEMSVDPRIETFLGFQGRLLVTKARQTPKLILGCVFNGQQKGSTLHYVPSPRAEKGKHSFYSTLCFATFEYYNYLPNNRWMSAGLE